MKKTLLFFPVLSIAFSIQLSSLHAQTYTANTAAGTINWYSWSGSGVNEVETDVNGNQYYDGYDGALNVNVWGTDISYTSTIHYSDTYGAVILNIAVTNNGASPSFFDLMCNGNLGSDGSTEWHFSNTGSSYYTVSSDNTIDQDGWDPVVSFLYGTSSLNPYSPSMPFSNYDDNHEFSISNVPIGAGQTRRFLIIGGVGNIDDDASNSPVAAEQAIQNLLNPANWPADFTSFLSNTEKAEVMNWSVLSTLPVTWKNFTANLQDSKVLLNWSTATEENTKNFSIEHSTNAVSWTSIGLVAAAGNSSMERSYAHAHNTPSIGKNYYRILQKDIDGRSSYSAVKVVTIENKQKTLELIGNPVKNGNMVVWVSQRDLVQLVDATGKVSWQQTLTSGTTTVNVSQLSTGMYFLKNETTTIQVLIAK